MSDIFPHLATTMKFFSWRCCCVCQRFMWFYSLHFAYYECYQSPSWSSSTFCYNAASLELLLLIKFRTCFSIWKDIIEFYFEWINYHGILHSLNEFSTLITAYSLNTRRESCYEPLHNPASTLKYSMKTLFCRLICIHRL